MNVEQRSFECPHCDKHLHIASSSSESFHRIRKSSQEHDRPLEVTGAPALVDHRWTPAAQPSLWGHVNVGSWPGRSLEYVDRRRFLINYNRYVLGLNRFAPPLSEEDVNYLICGHQNPTEQERRLPLTIHEDDEFYKRVLHMGLPKPDGSQRSIFLSGLTKAEIYLYCRGLVAEDLDDSEDGWYLRDVILPKGEKLADEDWLEITAHYDPSMNRDAWALRSEVGKLEEYYHSVVNDLKVWRLVCQGKDKTFDNLMGTWTASEFEDVVMGHLKVEKDESRRSWHLTPWNLPPQPSWIYDGTPNNNETETNREPFDVTHDRVRPAVSLEAFFKSLTEFELQCYLKGSLKIERDYSAQGWRLVPVKRGGDTIAEPRFEEPKDRSDDPIGVSRVDKKRVKTVCSRCNKCREEMCNKLDTLIHQTESLKEQLDRDIMETLQKLDELQMRLPEEDMIRMPVDRSTRSTDDSSS